MSFISKLIFWIVNFSFSAIRLITSLINIRSNSFEKLISSFRCAVRGKKLYGLRIKKSKIKNIYQENIFTKISFKLKNLDEIYISLDKNHDHLFPFRSAIL